MTNHYVWRAIMNHYMAFIKIIETGSFTKAADLLGYTQSGISQLMKTLENEVNTKLIIRSRTGVSLTPDGTHLYAYIKNLVQAKYALEQEMAYMEGLERSIIRIGVIASIVNHYLPEWMASFKEGFPTVTFELTLGNYSEIEQMILENEVDLGFVNPEVAHDIMTVPIVSDEYKVCVPLNHPLAQQSVIELAAIQHEPYILIKDGSVTPIQQYLERNHIEPQIEYIVSEDRIALEMIKKGLGISIMPSLIIPQSEQHIAIKPLLAPQQRHIHLAYKEFDILPLAARKFIDHVKKVAKEKGTASP